MEPKEVNEVLQGRTITSVEEGTTPGWIVLNFDPKEFTLYGPNDEPMTATMPEGSRVYMTIFVGGRKEETSEDREHWLCAVHTKAPEGWGIASPVRDGRDPEMPMGSAVPFLPDSKLVEAEQPEEEAHAAAEQDSAFNLEGLRCKNSKPARTARASAAGATIRSQSAT